MTILTLIDIWQLSVQFLLLLFPCRSPLTPLYNSVLFSSNSACGSGMKVTNRSGHKLSSIFYTAISKSDIYSNKKLGSKIIRHANNKKRIKLGTNGIKKSMISIKETNKIPLYAIVYPQNGNVGAPAALVPQAIVSQSSIKTATPSQMVVMQSVPAAITVPVQRKLLNGQKSSLNELENSDRKDIRPQPINNYVKHEEITEKNRSSNKDNSRGNKADGTTPSKKTKEAAEDDEDDNKINEKDKHHSDNDDDDEESTDADTDHGKEKSDDENKNNNKEEEINKEEQEKKEGKNDKNGDTEDDKGVKGQEDDDEESEHDTRISNNRENTSKSNKATMEHEEATSHGKQNKNRQNDDDDNKNRKEEQGKAKTSFGMKENERNKCRSMYNNCGYTDAAIENSTLKVGSVPFLQDYNNATIIPIISNSDGTTYPVNPINLDDTLSLATDYGWFPNFSVRS